MSRRSLLAFAAAALLLPLAPSPVRAEPPDEPPMEGPHHGGRNPEARLEKNLSELDLTPAQDEKIRAILAEAKSKRESRRGSMRADFERMRSLLDAESPDEAAVMAQADKIGALKTEQHKAMLHTLLAIRAELTPEQRAKLKEKMREQRGRWFHRRHKGGMSGGPPDAPPDEE